MGYAFTYPLFRILGQCPVICYVHYPTIRSVGDSHITVAISFDLFDHCCHPWFHSFFSLLFSTDMLEKVKADLLNLRLVTQNRKYREHALNFYWHACKPVYYRIFARLYSWVGSYVDLAIVSVLFFEAGSPGQFVFKHI
jgi:hypothetical protein